MTPPRAGLLAPSPSRVEAGLDLVKADIETVAPQAVTPDAVCVLEA